MKSIKMKKWIKIILCTFIITMLYEGYGFWSTRELIEEGRAVVQEEIIVPEEDIILPSERDNLHWWNCLHQSLDELDELDILKLERNIYPKKVLLWGNKGKVWIKSERINYNRLLQGVGDTDFEPVVLDIEKRDGKWIITDIHFEFPA